MASRFQGFRSPNYTNVPDELFDELLPDLSGAELKVLLYVIRRTFGFKKGSDRISKKQLEHGITKKDGEVLDRGTGLSRRAIRLAVDSLVAKRALKKINHSSNEKGDETTEYSLNLLDFRDPWVPSTPRGGLKVPRGEGKKVPRPGGRKVPPQDTVLQETVDNTRVRGFAVPGREARDPARELVAHFHELAGHPVSQKPLAKEFQQAASVLAEHGEETARWIVEFALQKAPETNYRPRHFGAVLSFVSDAIFARQAHLAAERRRAEQLEAERERERRVAAERETYAALSPEEKIEKDLERWLHVFPVLNRKRQPTEQEIEAKRRELATQHGRTVGDVAAVPESLTA